MAERFDRREHERWASEISCKIRCSRTGRYLGALTSDVSPGGAMLSVQTPTPMRVGQAVEVALRTDGRPIIFRSELVPARVVRCSSLLDRHQVVAVKFDDTQAELKASSKSAAA